LNKSIKHIETVPFTVPFFYGWIIVFVAAVGLFFSGPGQTYSISVFIEAYIVEFGWTRSLISGMYSAATLLAGCLLLIVGESIDRYGQRNIMTIVTFLLGLSCAWNGFIAGPIMLFVGFFLIRLLGQGSMTLIPSTLVSQWFVVHRGRALSFMAIGGFASSASIPFLNAWMISAWGTSITWFVWSGLLCLGVTPLVYFLVRDTPEKMGMHPDGMPVNLLTLDKKSSLYEDHWSLQEAMLTRTFWLLLFCSAVPAMVNTGLVFHLVSILGVNGISIETTAWVLSLMALLSFPFTFVAGYVNEKFSSHFVLVVIFVGQLIAMIILFQTHSVMSAILFGCVRGIVGGFESITLNIIWPRYYGRTHLGSINGVAKTTMVVASAFGPLPFGIAYDWFKGYNEILLIMMLFPLIGIILAWFSPQPLKR
jgi:MFS family permease